MTTRITIVAIIMILNSCIGKDSSGESVIQSATDFLVFGEFSESSFKTQEAFLLHEKSLAESKQLNFEAQKKLLEKALKLEPQNKFILTGLGLTELNLRNYEEGILLLTNAYRLDTTYLIAYINIANAYNALKQHEKAIEICDSAMERSSSRIISCAANHHKAKAFYGLNNLDKAILHLDQAIEFCDWEDVTKHLQETSEAWKAERTLIKTLNVKNEFDVSNTH